MKIKKVLVTGGAGYVGAVLVPKLLHKGYEVSVFDWYLYQPEVFKRFRKKGKLKEIKGDLRDRRLVEKELKGMDAVIHLACISNDPSFELDSDLGKSINYDASKHLVDLARRAKVTRFIYASSSSVYGVKDEKDVHEGLALEPLTDYSKYKAEIEKYILEKASDDFICLILRPATVCGYSDRLRLDLTVNLLTLQALVNKKITVFGGSQKRPNIHIEDMTDLYVKSLEYKDDLIHKRIYNAGYENYTVGDIALMIKRVIGDNSIEIVFSPTNDLRSYHISSKKIYRELGFKPIHSVEEAIRDLVDAYKKGLIPDPFTKEHYFNVKMMKKRKIK